MTTNSPLTLSVCSVKYVRTTANEVPNAFSVADSKPKSEAFNGYEFYTEFSKLELLMNYKF